jgi:hypothetical protein
MLLGFQTVHLLTQGEAQVALAAAAGSFVALSLDRPGGWFRCSLLFCVGQITAYYWTYPVMGWFSLAAGWNRPIGFIFGASGMSLAGGVMRFTKGISEDPVGTFGRVVKIWRGNRDEC